MSGTITNINGNTYMNGQQVAAPARKDLSMANFMAVLSAQLANQNPLEPMSDTSFFAQLAEMGTVQGMDELKSSMNVMQASSLLGKTVTAVQTMTDQGAKGGNQLVTGKVTQLKIQDGKYTLSLQVADGGTVDVAIGNVQNVSG